jgi:hypothetical protein
MLSPGDRVWVNIPKKGYVGVGTVEQAVQPASEFTVATEDGVQSVMDVVQHGGKYKALASTPELSEYFVKVKWIDTREANKAFNEVGLFGNQNTVCQPTTPKWRHTVELKSPRKPEPLGGREFPQTESLHEEVQIQ